jgi:alpha-galactosidase
MVQSRLAAHGFAYVNIDDGWMKGRGPDGVIVPDPARFPDMKALANYVHSLGLKLGIYSSPGPTTCQKLPGSQGYEEQDAATWAAWGVDYLKYDWCSYTSNAIERDRFRAPHFFYDDHLYIHFNIPVEEQRRPYLKMRAALDVIDRDIVFALCPMTLKREGNTSRWGRSVGGNLWRIGGDIRDNWRSMSRLGFAVAGKSEYAGPGGRRTGLGQSAAHRTHP